MKLTGEIVKIGKKTGTNARGRWTLYSLKLLLADGNESDWISVGFSAPDFKEGEYVTVEAEENDRGYIGAKPEDIEAAEKPKRSAGRSGSPSRGGSGSDRNSQSDNQGSSGAERSTQIVLQHSQEMAIQVVGLLLANNGLPGSKADSKAGVAKRFDEIVAAVDKFTVKYFNDVTSARLLETVEDMGVIDTSADGSIPNGDPTPDSDEDD